MPILETCQTHAFRSARSARAVHTRILDRQTAERALKASKATTQKHKTKITQQTQSGAKKTNENVKKYIQIKTITELNMRDNKHTHTHNSNIKTQQLKNKQKQTNNSKRNRTNTNH